MGDDPPPSYFKRWARSLKVSEFNDYLGETIEKSKLNPAYPDRGGFLVRPVHLWSTNRVVNIARFRMRTGHTATHTHLDKVGVDLDSLLCRYCKKTPETVEHVFMECERYLPKSWGPRMIIRMICRELGISFNQALWKKNDRLQLAINRMIEDLSALRVQL